MRVGGDQPVPAPSDRPGTGEVVEARQPRLPRGVRRTATYAIAAVAVAAVCWLVGVVLLRVALVSFTVAIALLLTALLQPLVARLSRSGWPRGLAAAVTLLLLVAVPIGIGLLLWLRVGSQLQDLSSQLTSGLDKLRTWLTTGPLPVDPSQIGNLRDQIVGYVQQAVPAPMAAARAALRILAAALLAVFVVFFFLKDGADMWRWLLRWAPARHRERVDGSGRRAWEALSGYVRGVVVVALVDALLIGAGLFLVGVPLWVSLTLLVFLGAFVPILGALLSGAVAVLVTSVTNGFGDALIILVLVLVVQQLEGNVLQPLIMGQTVALHPVVILVVVTCGTLLLGIPGAVLAVPVTAVVYRVAEGLRFDSSGPASDPDADPG